MSCGSADKSIDPAARPFWRPGSSGGGGVVLLHGLTASPTEVRPIADALAEADVHLNVSCPLLPGHGTTAAELRRTDPASWSQAVRMQVDRVAAGGGPVAVVGVSMGAVLAAEAAIVDSRVQALAMLAPVFRLSGIGAAALPLLRFVKPYVHKRRQSLENHRDKGLFSYDRYPLDSLLALRRLGGRVRNGLNRLAVPTLLAAGRRDRYVAWPEALALRDELQRNRRPGFRLDFVECPRSGHVLPHEADAGQLTARLTEFLQAAGVMGR